MKPQDLYRGQAPAAMGMMGQGLADVGANIGRMTFAGYQDMGKGIASGIEQAATAVKDYNTAKTSNDIYRKMIEDPEYGKILGLDPNAADYEDRKKNMLKGLNDIIKSHGEFGGAQFSQSALGAIQQYAALGRQYEQQLKVAEAQAKYNPAWAEVDAKNAYYRAQADALGRKSSVGGVNQFIDPSFSKDNTSVPPIGTNSGNVLSVPPGILDNLPIKEKSKLFKLQMGLPQGIEGGSTVLFGQ